MFSVDQINELLEILSRQNLLFISSKLGPDYLSAEELERLQSVGINPFHLYQETKDVSLMSFHFGLISDVIKESEGKKTTLEDIKNYFKEGKHIPLTEIERNTVNSIKKQFLGDIKANQGRIFQDVNNIISKNEKDNRAAYEKVIRDEIEKGKLLRKTSAEIARDLARKTGDWTRNFTRIVSYISHLAMSEGRASMMERRYGADVLVYCKVFNGACQYCNKLYKDSKGELKIFKLSELKSNGTNIGRKVADWKPTIPPIHPFCRCHIMFAQQESSNKILRKPIRVTIRGREYEV